MRSAIAIASIWSCVTMSADRSSEHDELPQPGARLLPELGIKVRQWLVDQNDGRLVDQRAGERHPLLLPARQLVRIARGEIAEPDCVSACSTRRVMSAAATFRAA